MTRLNSPTLRLAVLGASLAVQPLAFSSGVTLITHGFNGNVEDWIIPMSEAMIDYYRFPGYDFSCYQVTVASEYSVTSTRVGGISPLSSDSGEILVKLDWSVLADDIFNA